MKSWGEKLTICTVKNYMQIKFNKNKVERSNYLFFNTHLY